MAKKKNNTTKFYTVAGFTRLNGEVEPCTYTEVFNTRKEAAKFIAGEINDVLMDYDDEHREQWDCADDVKAKDCKDGYRLSCYNEADDILDLSIVEHEIEPIHAVVTFDQDNRTLNITTVESKDAAEKRVAECAKSYVKQEHIEYLYANRKGICEIDDDGIEDKEEYIHAGTTGGNFTAWTAVQIPVVGKADIDVQ